MRRIFALLVAWSMLAALCVLPAAAAPFLDIPSGAALATEVEKANRYGLMGGYSETRFGYSDPMTRAQFTAVLVRMMGWETKTPSVATYTDVPSTHNWYAVVETAAAHGVTDYTESGSGRQFRPGVPITRAEMSKLLVQALGLETAARGLNSGSDAPFTDLPAGNQGYISVAYAIGMTKGTTATTFSPNHTATRAQAAAMLVRIYEKIHQKTEFIHGFYAISSYSQLELAEGMDAVSFGWSRMLWDGNTALLSTTSANGNEFFIPNGYADVITALEQKRIERNLSVFMDVSGGVKELLASESGRTQATEQIIRELTVSYKSLGRNPYSGVTIDFEGLRAAQRENFNAFLRELAAELKEIGKSLSVCVSPVLPGSHYDGYDYGTIGSLAEHLILMAYDYDDRDLSDLVGSTYYEHAAPAPLDMVYRGLHAVVKEVDPSKVVLGFSTKNTAWRIDDSGKLRSGTPVYPNRETTAKRLSQSGTLRGWSQEEQQSYAIYTSENGDRWFLWYQDDKSVLTAMRTAKLLGVTSCSVWRLGNIPNDVHWNWKTLLGE